MTERKKPGHKNLISVVFIDNDPYEARAICRLCERSGGVSLHPLHSGKEAIHWLSHNHADVIVTDVRMSGINGIELIKILRGQGNLAPFIIYTDENLETIRQESANAHVDVCGYIVKNGSVRSRIPPLMNLIAQAAADFPGSRGDADRKKR